MAVATPKYKGTLKVDATGSATVTTDYSTDVIDVQAPFTKAMGTHFTIGSLYQQSTEGGMGVSITVTVRYSSTSTAAYQVFNAWAIAGGERTVQLYTPDTTTGSTLLSGEFLCAGPGNIMDIAGGSGDVHSVQFTFQSNGTFTLAAV
ncbi:MAG: hypothetical protein LCI00_16825 [Chloroflexi bacterium]|nr:hypothetical protein [Chloroflexota bacterium]